MLRNVPSSVAESKLKIADFRPKDCGIFSVYFVYLEHRGEPVYDVVHQRVRGLRQLPQQPHTQHQAQTLTRSRGLRRGGG